MDARIREDVVLYRKAFITGLREMADYLEAHPSVPTPGEGRYGASSAVEAYVFLEDKDTLTDAIRGTGGWDKDASESFMKCSRDFGEGTLRILLCIERKKVCRQVPTGETRTIPAKEAQPEREEPAYEWVCDDPLLAPSE